MKFIKSSQKTIALEALSHWIDQEQEALSQETDPAEALSRSEYIKECEEAYFALTQTQTEEES